MGLGNVSSLDFVTCLRRFHMPRRYLSTAVDLENLEKMELYGVWISGSHEEL